MIDFLEIENALNELNMILINFDGLFKVPKIGIYLKVFLSIKFDIYKIMS